MHLSHTHYFPISLTYLGLLSAILIVLFAIFQLGVLQYAYARLGLGPRPALLLLAGSLVGSYLNIPVVQLPDQQVSSSGVVDAFGVTYLVPVVVDWPGTMIAVNIGGAVIPAATSLYLFLKQRLWVRGVVCVVIVACVCHFLARPVPGLGIAMPTLAPGIAAGAIALALSIRRAAALAYIGGSLGALIGADLTNLGRVQGLGAPIASIGGAGTFDGVFVTGVIAVLIAGLSSRFAPEPPDQS